MIITEINRYQKDFKRFNRKHGIKKSPFVNGL